MKDTPYPLRLLRLDVYEQSMYVAKMAAWAEQFY